MIPQGFAQAAIASGARLVAARYSRVSNDKHGDQRSVEEQDTDNLEVCEDEGWDPGELYCDNDLSASRFSSKKRRDWDRLLEDLGERRFHVVILWESSRGDRRFARWITFLDQCRDLGVLIHITSHERTYDVRKRRDYKTLAEEGLDSADASELTSERVRRGSKSRAGKGRPHGRTLYGYERVYTLDDKGQRQLHEVVPDEQPRETVSQRGEPVTYTAAGVVREIIARLASGDASRNIAVSLNMRGIPSPRNGVTGWSNTRIREIGTNPAYIARRVHQGQVLEDVKAIWPALVEVAVFRAAGSRFAPAGTVRKNEGSVKRLLTGLAVCGVCGSTVRRMGPGAAPKYNCFPTLVSEGGFCVARDVARTDSYVERSVWLRLANADLAFLVAQDRRADEREQRLEAEILEKETRLEEARASFAEGKLPLKSLERIEAALGPQIDRARDLIQQTRVAPVIRDLVGRDLAAIEAEWKRRSIPQRREVLRALTERIVILPLGSRKRYPPEDSVRIEWRQDGAAAGSSGMPADVGVDVG